MTATHRLADFTGVSGAGTAASLGVQGPSGWEGEGREGEEVGEESEAGPGVGEDEEGALNSRNTRRMDCEMAVRMPPTGGSGSGAACKMTRYSSD